MNRGKELVKNIFILAVGTFLPKLSSIITLPIITAGLTKAEYGTYDLINTLVALFLPVITLQIHAASFRFLIDYRGDKKGESKVVTNLFAFILPVTSVALVILYFALYKLDSATRILICCYFFVDLLFMAVQQVVRGFSKNKLYSVSSVVTSLTNVLLIIITVWYASEGLFGVILSITVATALGTVILVIYGKVFQYIDFSLLDKSLIMEMLKYSWPLVPNSVSNWVLSASDRLVLTLFLGVEANALYAVANKIPSLFITVQSTFVYAWQENASLVSKDEDVDKYYSDMFDNIFCILCGIMSMLISFTPVLFWLLIRGDYAEAYYQMPILFMGMFFSAVASFMSGIYVAHKKTTSVGISTIIAAVINLAVDLLAVNLIGVFAASISTMVSYMVLAIYRMIDVKNFQPIKYNLKKIIVCVGILIGLCVICFMNTVATNIINFVLSCVFAVSLNKKVLTIILKRGVEMLKRGE